MLSRIFATRFGRKTENGRTRPVVLFCNREDDAEEIEVYVKLHGSPELTPSGLMCEGIAAMLGRDLGLPIPEPFAVEITEQFAAAVEGTTGADLISTSVGLNFGSEAKHPYAPWTSEKAMPISMRAKAANVFAFDAMIQNPDRRFDKPNCKVWDEDLLIYDHDLAFSFLNGVLFWKPPWKTESLDFLTGQLTSRHVFFDELKGIPHAFDRLNDAWNKIDSARLNSYFNALPTEWIPTGMQHSELWIILST